MPQYFTFDGENFQTHNKLTEAMSDAQAAIDCYSDQCDPEWPEETANICYGVILGCATEQDPSPEQIEGMAPIPGYEDMQFINYVLDDPYGAYMKQPAEQTGDHERYHYTEIVQAIHEWAPTMLPGLLSEVATQCCMKQVFKSPLNMLRFFMRSMSMNGDMFPKSILVALADELKKEQADVKA